MGSNKEVYSFVALSVVQWTLLQVQSFSSLQRQEPPGMVEGGATGRRADQEWPTHSPTSALLLGPSHAGPPVPYPEACHAWIQRT